MSENVMLAKKWDQDKVNPSGWLMSEKYDGVRFDWQPDKKIFMSRNAKPFVVPDRIIKAMPDFPVEGEFWEGYSRFKHTSGIVRRTVNLTDWDDVKLLVFDFPKAGGKLIQRIKQIAEYTTSMPNFMSPINQYICTGVEHLEQFEKRVVEQQHGEGVILRHPESEYEYRRSPYMLKVKRFKDSEAVVTDYQPGKGKYENMCGALVCSWATEKFGEVSIELGAGLTDSDRLNPPAIGTKIKFKYFSRDDVSGKPILPVYLGLRED